MCLSCDLESPANIGWTHERCCVPLFALTLRDGLVGAQLKKEKQEATALGEGGEVRSTAKVIPAAQRRVQKGHPLLAPRPPVSPAQRCGQRLCPNLMRILVRG